MVESAPLFIEYYCQGYVNCTAFNVVIAILLIACAGSWLLAFYTMRRFWAQLDQAVTK